MNGFVVLFLLDVYFKKGNFFDDILFPGLALCFVLVLILNSILGKFGYKLF